MSRSGVAGAMRNSSYAGAVFAIIAIALPSVAVREGSGATGRPSVGGRAVKRGKKTVEGSSATIGREKDEKPKKP